MIQEQSFKANVYPLAGSDRHLIYSNGAVQIRLGLELADSSLAELSQMSCLLEGIAGDWSLQRESITNCGGTDH